MIMEEEPYCSIFLFVNSSSGGGVGQKLIQQETQKIEFEIPIVQSSSQKKLIHVYFFNMKTKREKGFITLKKLTQKNYKTMVIVCGGDGTVVWVVGQFNKYNIDPFKAPIGIIPLGTGNDFSQYLGWGKLKTVLIQNSFLSLKKLIRKWLNAKIQEFDIWDVKAEVQEYGKLQKVQNFQNKQLPQKSFSRSFCNYFSFGIDGKIGYSFDMHRTSSRIGNLAMYGTLGLLKAMTKTKLVEQLVQSATIRPQLASDMIESQQTFEPPLQNLKSQSKKSSLNSPQKSQFKQQNNLEITRSKFLSKVNEELAKTQNNVIQIKKGYYNIVALNINSYMGGVTDIWKNATIGLQNKASKQFKQASSNDGKLQFVSFSSSVGMAVERTFGGFAQKVYQGGEYPIYFQFKKYDPKLKHRTYLQIDGQFLRFTHPKSILIQKSHLIKNGKIKVLRNMS